MTVRIGPRIEVRLDDEHRAKLAKIVEVRGAIEEQEREIALAEWDARVDRLQRTATWTPSEQELGELLNDPQLSDDESTP